MILLIYSDLQIQVDVDKILAVDRTVQAKNVKIMIDDRR